jgi:hypothetical protein
MLTLSGSLLIKGVLMLHALKNNKGLLAIQRVQKRIIVR